MNAATNLEPAAVPEEHSAPKHPVTPPDRRYFRLEMEALRGELGRWGRWVEQHSDYSGFPAVSVLEAWRTGRGGSTAGHRILCLEMPVDVYSAHHRVLRLQEALQDAVIAWYVVRLKSDGTLWSIAEKCTHLRISERTLRRYVAFAHADILGIPRPA